MSSEKSGTPSSVAGHSTDNSRRTSFGSSAQMAQALLGKGGASPASGGGGAPVAPPRKSLTGAEPPSGSAIATSGTTATSMSGGVAAMTHESGGHGDSKAHDRWLAMEESDYQSCFGMNKTEFDAMPKWKQTQMRKEKDLF